MRYGGLLFAVAALAACGESPPEPAPSRLPEPSIVATTERANVPSATQSAATTVATTSGPTSPEGTKDGLEGTWRATDGTVNGAPVELIYGAPITLMFDGSHVAGTAACNDYQYAVNVTGNDIVFEDGFVSAVGCEPPIAALQDAFLGSFGPEVTFEVDQGMLAWRTPTATWVFERVAPAADAALAGTVWILDGVVYEFGALTTPWIGDARIEFAAGGVVTGSTSCRDFTGGWSLEDGIVQINGVEFAGACEPERAQVDDIVAQVIEEGFMASVDGQRLLARPGSDLGLDYLAAP